MLRNKMHHYGFSIPQLIVAKYGTSSVSSKLMNW